MKTATIGEVSVYTPSQAAQHLARLLAFLHNFLKSFLFPLAKSAQVQFSQIRFFFFFLIVVVYVVSSTHYKAHYKAFNKA